MCINPVILKSGIAVPCGRCRICRSDIRNEWSIRIAIELMRHDRMPLFITLTYDNEHLPLAESCNPTLCRADVSKFLKDYKRINSLSNEDFTYFGCGEFGDQFGRPHYHLLFFGDTDLYNLYFMDEESARTHLMKCWKNGFVHVGLAGYDGIHYVTKYCLKEGLHEVPDDVVKPFTIASKNLGSWWLKSKQCDSLRAKLDWLMAHQDELYRMMPHYDLCEPESVEMALSWLRQWIPRFEIILDDGRKVFLPRYFKKKLIGSFEHFKDNPLWLYNHLLQLRDSLDYYRQFAEYDKNHDVNMSMNQVLTRLEKINKRLKEKKYNLKFKH